MLAMSFSVPQHLKLCIVWLNTAFTHAVWKYVPGHGSVYFPQIVGSIWRLSTENQIWYRQAYIPIGCVTPAAVAISGGGCTPPGRHPTTRPLPPPWTDRHEIKHYLAPYFVCGRKKFTISGKDWVHTISLCLRPSNSAGREAGVALTGQSEDHRILLEDSARKREGSH